jgi:putative acetyltransferase
MAELAITEISGGSDPDVAIARLLFLEYAGSLPIDLEYQNFSAELAALPAPYVPPGGALLLARLGERPVGVVGLKPLSPEIGEVKRLFVLPEARRRRVGEALLCRAIDEAMRIGYLRLRLDSHRPSMAAAIALYRRLGFVEIPPYGEDLAGQLIFFEKRLGQRPAPRAEKTPWASLRGRPRRAP